MSRPAQHTLRPVGLRALAGLRHRFIEDRFDAGLDIVLDGLATRLFG